MNKIVGSIAGDTEGRKRRKLTLAQRVAALDEKIKRADALKSRLVAQRARLVTDAKVRAEALAAEAEAAGR